MTERTNDDLNTPDWLIGLVVRAIGPIGLDPCSNPWSRVGAAARISRHDGHDGLAYRWAAHGQKTFFVNPPYSSPKAWAERAAEAVLDGMEGIWLGKLDPSTEWSAILRLVRDAQCDLHKRISFVGGAHKTGQFPSSLVYFGPRAARFKDTFRPFGCVYP